MCGSKMIVQAIRIAKYDRLLVEHSDQVCVLANWKSQDQDANEWRANKWQGRLGIWHVVILRWGEQYDGPSH